MKTIDDTGFDGIRILQDTDGFRYGIDAVLLADFAKECCAGAESAAELGCGNGIVSLLLAAQSDERRVTGIEFQEEAVRLAEKSRGLNGMTDRVRFRYADVAALKETHPELASSASLVVTNPPYIARGSGIPGSRQQMQSARQETTADLEDFVQTAAWMLKAKGSFCMVHRPFRLVDIFYYCRKHQLEPKRIRFVHPRKGKPPNIVLIHCVLGGGRELKFDDPIYVYQEGGGYSHQILEIYGKTE